MWNKIRYLYHVYDHIDSRFIILTIHKNTKLWQVKKNSNVSHAKILTVKPFR